MNEIKYHRPEIRKTTDGSSTLNHSVLDELYHSRHGAWTESQHIFIQYGLMEFADKNPEQISVFEMGFGSGLNASMAHNVAQTQRVRVDYVSVELYPVDAHVVETMTMPQQPWKNRDMWLKLHGLPWNEKVLVDPYFMLHKIMGSFPDVSIPGFNSYDLVFYDAFAPGAQPELWGVEALGRCFDLLKPGGVWISYCSKGSVKRNLRDVGFQVEALPGPPGKREITRAIKQGHLI